MILCPARLEPIFSARPWGALSLAPFFPEKTNLPERIGEAWMTGDDCRFASGAFAGAKVGDAWPAMPPEWTGARVNRNERFPLLVKFIFAEDKLSVQVHPDDEYASRHEAAAGGRGKTEMWYVVDARPGAEALVGLKPEVTAESFRHAIAGGSAETCLEHVALVPGDAVFVPSGTAHTICGGLVLCEIQQHSDITYRVHDYNRRDAQGRARDLHIEKALDVMRFGKQQGGKIVPLRTERGTVTETYFASCRYFSTEKWEFTEPADGITSREHFELLIFLEGKGEIRWNGERIAFGPAQVWMIPAALGAYQLSPEKRTSLLRTYVPNDPEEFPRRMAERNIAKEAWSKLVHP